MSELVDILTPAASIEDILAIEGDPISPTGSRFAVAAFTKSDGTTAGTTTNGPSGLISGSGYPLGTVLTIPPCRAFYVKNLILAANKKVNWNIFLTRFKPTAGTVPAANFNSYSDPAGGALIIPVNDFLLGQTGTDSISASIRQVFDADLTLCEFYVGVTGWSINNDLNFSAPKTILHIGDSITRLETGNILPSTAYPFAVTRYFKETQGINCRQITKAYSGATSATIEDMRAKGFLDVKKKLDLITYNLGMNDALGSVTKAAHKANVAAAIAWKQKRHPDAKMIVYGPTPAENNAVEAFLVQYREGCSEAVTAAADDKVKFCDLGGSFDRTVSSNYASTDTAGSRIHPSDQGQTAVSAVVNAFLAANMTSI